MALLIRNTPGDDGFDMRVLNFDDLIAGMSVTASNPFIIQWKPAVGDTVASLLGDGLNPTVVGGVLQGLTGTAITQLTVNGNDFSLNIAGMSYSVSDFVDLVDAKDWRGLADFVRQGNDSIVGTKNDDTLLGGDGNDTFVSSAGSDRMNGGAGQDTLLAMGGHDVMRGGKGADFFQFEAEPEVGDESSVVIKDFRHGVDRISVSDTAFNDVGFGGFDGAVMLAEHFHLGRAATTDEQAIVYNRAKGLLFYDPDGVGGVDQVLMARMGAGTVLTYDDMWVI